MVVVSVVSKQPSTGAPFETPAVQPLPSILLLGDSYAAGTGASLPGKSWAGLVSTNTDWTVTNLARGGTGFLKSYQTGGFSACGQEECPDFQTMAERAYRDGVDPDLIVVSGGRNDLSQPVGQEQTAVRSLFLFLEKRFPHARIVATNPLWDASDAPAALSKLGDYIRERVGGANFLDLGQPLAGRPDRVADDDVHPNDQGHAAIARAIRPLLGDALKN
ncbi:lysophospholipase L1-like esterase [Nocardioides aurantiacus]|uniref:Lysophospholipase L1-like esterase n=1 Tax=Nocardioides aurantiacus TaxID=86796 RepID=A0A3N2CSI6_9ACTN|nr:lysophospholipase L1-like esterase [Nocardioides aurantiacus]